VDPGTYVATDESSIELIPAISLVVEGDDLPALRQIDYVHDSWFSWCEDRTRWRADLRNALGLRPWPALGGLFALDDTESSRLLNIVYDHVRTAAAEFGWSPFLDGGLVLVVDSRSFAAPTCCVDLEEGVRDWKALCVDWPSTWTSVESGHPGVLARRLGDRVQFSPQADDFDDPIPVAVDVPFVSLHRALGAALASIDAFALRLGSEFERRGIEDAHRLGRLVAGLPSE
jgi:hypothetical protein